MLSNKYVSFVLLLSCLAFPAHALKVGDSVDAAALAKLGASPGKVTVVDFFAEWCASCRKELPLVSALAGRLDSKRVEVVGVDVTADPALSAAFQAELRAKKALNFRVINDPQQQLVAAFRPLGFPALYLLKDGKVARRHLGAVADIDKLIARELAELGVTP